MQINSFLRARKEIPLMLRVNIGEVVNKLKTASSRVRELNGDTALDIVMGAPVTFVTGKGGVGKTTVASLLSQQAHSHGERTLFISLYKDNQTSQILGISDKDAEQDIFRSRNFGFDVSIITPTSALISYLASKHMGALVSKLRKTGLLDMIANIVPGMRELLVLGEIRAKADSKKWDRIIVDAPSTGHARSLFNIHENASAIANSGVIKHQGEMAREFLKDSKKTQVVVVTLDHIMPLVECKEFIFEIEEDMQMKIAGCVINKTDVAKNRKSERIDKIFSNIFIPLFGYPNQTPSRKSGFFQKRKNQKQFLENLETEIKIPSDTRACITLGTGGVGKTSTAAAIALKCALENRNVALLTIDPARRLGTALGLSDTTVRESHLDARTMKTTNIEDANFHVFQLETQHEFLQLLEKTLDVQAFEDAKNNSFVKAISKMGIVNEFMAIEAMHSLVSSLKYDIVIVDTPPSHHVFDLLEAPAALSRMTNSQVYKTLVGAGTMASITTNMALNTIFRPLKGLVGADLVTDAIEFMRTLKDVEEELTKHSGEMVEFLSRSTTRYIVICNSSAPSREQALDLVKGMFEREFENCEVVINGVDVDEIVETGQDKDLKDFSDRLRRFDTGAVILPELELDSPFEIVKSLAENVDFES